MAKALLCVSVAFGLVFLPAGIAQQSQSVPQEVRVSSRPYVPFQFRAESALVQTGVVVRDGKGHAISGLQQSDFRLTDQGKERNISVFSVDTRDVPGGTGSAVAKGHEPPPYAPPPASVSPHPPRFIALFFDDIGTQAGDLARMKIDAKRFVEDGMTAGARLAVVASSAGRMTGFLTDKQQIESAIAKVGPHPRFSPDGDVCPPITPYDAYLIANNLSGMALQAKVIESQICGGGGSNSKDPLPSASRLNGPAAMIQERASLLWDHVRSASQTIIDSVDATLTDLSNQRGTRMLLLVSSGFLVGPLEEREDPLINKALQAGVVVNTMDAKGLYVEAPVRPFGAPAPLERTPAFVTAYETMMQNAAAETPTAILADLAEATGGLFFHHNNDFSFGFRELGLVPEVTYVLGFQPDKPDSKFHRLKVRLAPSNSYTIEARPGYFAAPRLAATEDDGRGALEREVMTAESIQQFGTKLELQYGAKTASGATPIHILLRVDINGLDFAERDGRFVQKLTFVFALLDDKSNIVNAREGLMEFALTDAKLKSLQKDGVNAALTLEAPAGTYRLRAVAVEGLKSRMAAQAYAVQVP